MRARAACARHCACLVWINVLGTAHGGIFELRAPRPCALSQPSGARGCNHSPAPPRCGAEHLFCASRRDAFTPAAADDSDDRDAETPADFFGFFVDVHKGLVTELKEEFQRIPESSTKIVSPAQVAVAARLHVLTQSAISILPLQCKRLGLPICAQMRAAVKPAPRNQQTEAAEMTP